VPKIFDKAGDFPWPEIPKKKTDINWPTTGGCVVPRAGMFKNENQRT